MLYNSRKSDQLLAWMILSDSRPQKIRKILTYGSNCRIRHGESPDKHSMFEGFKIFRNKIGHQNRSIGQIAG